nr:MAG TPA: hypothetical protein [Caudoviricetes sp.]
MIRIEANCYTYHFNYDSLRLSEINVSSCRWLVKIYFQ